jgi:hypothetical protein
MNRQAIGIARTTLYLGVVGYLLHRLWNMREVLQEDLDRVGWRSLTAAGGLAFTGLVAAMLGWRVLLTAFGSHLTLPVAARVYFVAGLGKYLPGALWPAAGQADLARAMGMPPWRFAAAFLGSVVVSVVTAAVLALPAIPWLTSAGAAWQITAMAAALALAAVSPSLLIFMFRGAARLSARISGREPITPLPSKRAIVGSLTLTAVGWIVAAAHLAVLAAPLGAPIINAPMLTAGYCLATLAGMLTVIMPAGLGTREIVLMVVVGTALPGSAVLSVVVLSRFLLTAVDVMAAAVIAPLRHRQVTSSRRCVTAGSADVRCSTNRSSPP